MSKTNVVVTEKQTRQFFTQCALDPKFLADGLKVAADRVTAQRTRWRKARDKYLAKRTRGRKARSRTHLAVVSRKKTAAKKTTRKAPKKKGQRK